jgi:hypothetical protein
VIRLFVIGITLLLLLSLAATPAFAANGNGKGNGGNSLDVNGPHYNLNIIGKKADWNNKSGFSNPDRHTVFVPQYTAGEDGVYGTDDDFKYLNPPWDDDGLQTDPDSDGDPMYISGSIKVEISQDKSADDIYIIDGTAFDGDGKVAIALPDRKYDVYICSKAKPGFYTDIDAMVYYDSTLGEWLFCIGEITVTRNWQSMYDLFYVTQSEDVVGTALGVPIIETMWIFDYLDYLAGINGEDPETTEYFWDFDNQGNKLVKVRFYPAH